MFPSIHQTKCFSQCAPASKRSKNGGGEELPRHADTTREVAALLPDGGLHRAAEGRPGHRVVGGTTRSGLCVKAWIALRAKPSCCAVVVVVLMRMGTSSKVKVWVARPTRINNFRVESQDLHLFPYNEVATQILIILQHSKSFHKNKNAPFLSCLVNYWNDWIVCPAT